MKFINSILVDKRKDFYIFNLIIPIFFITFALILMPIDQIFYFDTDEGIELAKASLFSQNLLFNHDFWDPQPLLFNILVGKYLQIFGFSIITARVFTLIFATLLVWCFSQIIKLSVGNLIAVISTFLLIISVNFLRLSVSVMQAIPCLTLAILAIYFLVLFTKKNEVNQGNNINLILLSLTGISLGISLQLKMITIFFVPVIILYLFLIIPNLKQKISSIFAFVIPLTISFIIIGLLTKSLDLQKIFLFHISGDLKKAYHNYNSLQNVTLIYLQNLDFLLLTIVSLKFINFNFRKIKDNHLYLLPLLWLISITLLLLNHKPVWYHYLILISVPLLWLGSYGIKEIIILLKDHQFKIYQIFKNKLIAFTVIFSLIVIPVKLGVINWNNNLLIKESQPRLINLQRINAYQNQTNWLFTDIAMYGFYSNLKIPPEIAVFPAKRLISGNINQEILLNVLEKYQPEQILIARFPVIIELIKPYLDTHYRKIYEDEKTQHYLIQNLK